MAFDPYYPQIDPSLYAQQAVFPPPSTAPAVSLTMVQPPIVKRETPGPHTPGSSTFRLIPPTEVSDRSLAPHPPGGESSQAEAGVESLTTAKGSKKSKIPRAGHGVGAGGGMAVSTYKNKPLMWVPPPTYPYNLIPGRDLTADVIPPRPSETASGFLYPPIDESVMVMAAPAQPMIKKKKKAKKPVEDVEDDMSAFGDELMALTPEEEAARAAAAERRREKAKQKAEAAAKSPVGSSASKKPGYREKTEKAKLLELEKEEKEREKAERAAARLGGSKAKGSDKDKENKAKGTLAKTGTKGRAVTFAANQGERVAGARNAIHEEFEEEEEPEEEIEVDTRLYCICKQMYDDDRIMIACDNCDDWCHPGCVGLLEEDLDLVDLFYCPACLAAHPNLTVTYKTACARDICRHPARLPLSKFCSDECGILCVMKRVDEWNLSVDPPPIVPPPKLRPKLKAVSPAEPAGTPVPLPMMLQKLEATRVVRYAKRREGLVSIENVPQDLASLNEQAARRKAEEERTVTKYRDELAGIKQQRARHVRMQASVNARIAFFDVILQRAQWLDSVSGGTGVCGYDYRVQMDEEVWLSWMESNESMIAFEGYGIGEDDRDTEDSRAESEVVGRTVCRERRKCERHGGWQKLRMSDLELERRMLEQSLQKLAERDREVRIRISELEALQTPPELSRPRSIHPDLFPKVEEPASVTVVMPDSPIQVDVPSSGFMHPVVGMRVNAPTSNPPTPPATALPL